MNHLADQFKIFGVVIFTKLAALGLDEVNTLASILAYLCGAVASISVAILAYAKKKALSDEVIKNKNKK